VAPADTASTCYDLGYDGTVPGPTLRIGRGEELRVRVVNDVAEPTSVHWHGVRDERPIGAAPVPAQSAASGRSSGVARAAHRSRRLKSGHRPAAS
jgi:FtsP/CotA-like multicopper oxidase with cupredoxin domain